jgi:hypothetical protein
MVAQVGCGWKQFPHHEHRTLAKRAQDRHVERRLSFLSPLQTHSPNVEVMI